MAYNKVELAAFVLEVEPEVELPQKLFLGRALHAWVLDIIRKAEPNYSQLLHEETGLKPFTTSWVQDRNGSLVRVTALEGRVAGILEEAIRGLKGAYVTWDEIPFHIKEVTLAGHPLAGGTNYQELSRPWLCFPPKSPPNKIRLKFLTPTTFKHRGFTYPLPIPELVFGSLLERWNLYAPVALPKELMKFIKEEVVVSKFNLRTRAIPLAGAVHIGFVGIIEFSTLNPNPYLLSLLHLLSDFAFFSAVGAKTAMCFGTCIKVQ